MENILNQINIYINSTTELEKYQNEDERNDFFNKVLVPQKEVITALVNKNQLLKIIILLIGNRLI